MGLRACYRAGQNDWEARSPSLSWRSVVSRMFPNLSTNLRKSNNVSYMQRCAGVPDSVLVYVLSQLPHLRELRLKGAPSTAIPHILASLPKLVSLDTEHLGSSIYRPSDEPLPCLKRLTVRTSSVDLQGPQQLWVWLRQLIPVPSLESFVLNAFSLQGQTTIP